MDYYEKNEDGITDKEKELVQTERGFGKNTEKLERKMKKINRKIKKEIMEEIVQSHKGSRLFSQQGQSQAGDIELSSSSFKSDDSYVPKIPV